MSMPNFATAVPLPPQLSPVSPGKQWVETRLPSGRHELKLWGKFPPRWLANLTAALSARQINVQCGSANKLSPTVWQGTFELIPAAGQTLPAHLDYYQLAQHDDLAPPPAVIILDKVLVEKRADAIFVEVRGADSVGFLMSMLKLFTFYSLYPAEVSIDTPQGRVLDRFWLKGLGGSTPTDELCTGLRLELRKHLAL